MKKADPNKNPFPNIPSSLLVALFALPGFSTPDIHLNGTTISGPGQPYNITINKLLENKNYNIEMYSSPTLKQLLISAGPEQKKIYRFYLFDIDGKLKAEASIRRNSKTALVNISSGDYIFEIYNNDERIENGKLTVE